MTAARISCIDGVIIIIIFFFFYLFIFFFLGGVGGGGLKICPPQLIFVNVNHLSTNWASIYTNINEVSAQCQRRHVHN